MNTKISGFCFDYLSEEGLVNLPPEFEQMDPLFQANILRSWIEKLEDIYLTLINNNSSLLIEEGHIKQEKPDLKIITMVFHKWINMIKPSDEDKDT